MDHVSVSTLVLGSSSTYTEIGEGKYLKLISHAVCCRGLTLILVKADTDNMSLQV